MDVETHTDRGDNWDENARETLSLAWCDSWLCDQARGYQVVFTQRRARAVSCRRKLQCNCVRAGCVRCNSNVIIVCPCRTWCPLAFWPRPLGRGPPTWMAPTTEPLCQYMYSPTPDRFRRQSDQASPAAIPQTLVLARPRSRTVNFNSIRFMIACTFLIQSQALNSVEFCAPADDRQRPGR